MVDQMVLRAQEWVNSTYNGVNGYVSCEETGKTGWEVMWSLTRALQIELGMTTFASSVGPATLQKLEDFGPVDGNITNVRIRTIAQAALYCKGYSAGRINGDWGGAASGYHTADAVEQMHSNMGLGDDMRALQPKSFKALLTMDAYVIVQGGNTEIRRAQQWMNGQYWQQSWASIAPTDGHFSRDVQKAMVRIIQHELGFTLSNITGTVGPLTRTTLATKEQQVGATGLWVQILSALAVFNGAVASRFTGALVRTAFKTTFDQLLADYLAHVQAFAQLPIDGQAKIDTWLELLVSTGNPDRTTVACDTSTILTTAKAAALSAAGYTVVGRYLENAPVDNARNKRLAAGEVARIHAAGLRLFPIWQYNARNINDFDYSSGLAEGRLAYDRMAFYDFAPGGIAYFAVDYDAMDPDITNFILPYFRGVQEGFRGRGRLYQVGVYGPRNVCTRVSREAGASSSFVSGMSVGFSGNLGFTLPPNWAFNQIKEFSFPSSDGAFPLDNVVHRASADTGIGPENMKATAATPFASLLSMVQEVHALAAAYPGGGDPNKLTMEYLRAPKYAGVDSYPGWPLLMGFWDEAWLQYSYSHFSGWLSKDYTYMDPIWNVPISLDHLVATAHAVQEIGEGTADVILGGDFGGWAGDLASFASEYDSSGGLGPRAFCNQNLARLGVASTWSLNDMIEDIDGSAIGQLMAGGMTFPDALELHLKPGGATISRFRDFLNRRFPGLGAAGTRDAIKQAVSVALVSTDTAKIQSSLQILRLGVYTQSAPLFYNPLNYSANVIEGIVDGVADVFLDLASMG